MTTNIHAHKILILDFGSQYSQLIARRVREIGVYCEILPYDISAERIKDFAPKGIILSGGPESVTAEQTPRAPQIVFELGCPVLGICYGMQTMVTQLGGEVAAATQREFGSAQITVTAPSVLLAEIEDKLDVWMSHGDHVIALPPEFTCVASSANAPVVIIADEQRHFYGVQFHPEVTHTPQGKQLLTRFVVTVCHCETLWTPQQIIADTIDHVKQQVKDDQVILGLSGGVDSSVVAALLHQAIGDQLTCVFVDTGLLRLHEADQVMATFAKHMGVKVIKVDAKEQFYTALAGVSDPEAKRKIAGRVFVDVFQHQASLLEGVKWLAQGTIYPDVIESAHSSTGKAHVIKSHHNVGGLPEHLHLELLEPLRELFKDEVRKIGVKLGLPHELVYRHPFPGPGLGIRVLGEIKPEFINLLQQADHIFLEELRRQQLYDKVSQAFAVFLPVKSVGVMGDARKYEYVIALRAVETVDFMTAIWAQLPYEFLQTVSNRIVNEIPGISRVVYDISSKPPATIEWE